MAVGGLWRSTLPIEEMPKIKSRGSVKRRFKVTKSGKVKSSRPKRGHLHAPKSAKQSRGKRKPLVIDGTWAVLLRRMTNK